MISEQHGKMQALYDTLANQLSEATVHPESITQLFDRTLFDWKQ